MSDTSSKQPAQRSLRGFAKQLGIPEPSPRQIYRALLNELRKLLDGNALERELQEALHRILLLELHCKAAKEVVLTATEHSPAIRMDLVVEPPAVASAEIVELKRGSHLLLARRGRSTMRLSRQLERALEQIRGYGDRVASDSGAVASIADGHGIQISKPCLRLVAGRRLSNAEEYHLLSLEEARVTTDSARVLIYTWDGLLAELERIFG